MATVESFERQGNQTTRVFTRTTYLTLANKGIEGGFLNSHSCSIIVTIGTICNNMFWVTRLTVLNVAFVIDQIKVLKHFWIYPWRFIEARPST